MPEQSRLGVREGTSLKQMVTWTGLRWNIEDDNKAGKNEFGLGDNEVRTWTSWHRYVTSSMLAHAFSARTGGMPLQFQRGV